MNEWRVLDLFSGIGGFSLGLERAGMRTVAFCEIDGYCRRVLSKHWPDIPCAEDITRREFRKGEADIICGGFPCQDISIAGAGTGITGTRSGLWRELLRAVRVVRPRFVIVENVAALLDRGLGTILGDLAEIGYDAEWHCVPASHVGALHDRDRVWIVAYPQEIGWLAWDRLDPRRTERAAEQLIGSIGRAVLAARRQPRAWATDEPGLARLVHGVPREVQRIGALGNAVVPQIPELIGRAIIKAHGDSK